MVCVCVCGREGREWVGEYVCVEGGGVSVGGCDFVCI